MRILHIITSLRTGGAEKLLVDLLPKLRDLGNDVELLLLDGVQTPFLKRLEALDITLHIARIGGWIYDPRNIIYIREFLNKYDIIHTHNTAPQLFAAIAHACCFNKKVKLVTTEHNTTNRRRDKFYFKPIDTWMYGRYSKIICISKQAESNLRLYLDDNTSRISTIFNGIDFAAFSNSSIVREHKQDDNGIILVTMVAAFREQKDQQTLIRAISLLPENIKLQLIGGGEDHLIEKCKKLVYQLNLNNRVDFGGIRTDIPQVLHSSDIVVLSSHYEGLSLSSLEGMASGCPFVASDVDGLHEIVDGYGLLFPHGDAQTLADIILRLSKDKAFATQVTLKCLERARQFDISEMADNYNRVYQKLL